MTCEMIFANARLCLPGEVITGQVQVRDGLIAGIDTGAAVPAGAIDCAGDWLSPGLIELHTDNLERHISPRPKVNWPHHAAIVAHDAELAGCGISTVFDAIRVGSIMTGHRADYARYARAMADEILAMRARGALRISHHLHLRAETCSETLIEELEEFGADDRVGIVSLMDHTPGQRQFADISKFETYVRGKHAMSETDFADYLVYLEGLYARLGATHEAATVAAAARFGATLASHDDTTAAHVAASAAHGVKLAEFPTTLEAARACRERGIAVIMGAPNLIRGGSHSGNVAAADLADAGILDIVSSDYVPAALLQAAVRLGHRWGDMAQGMATVTAAPAAAVGLADRGRLAVGLRADLLRFAEVGGVPVTRGLWVQGARVA
ncbi:MAG: alpha-D-ribose 1-methylphosphonate 5-triphosphate diphosphatase [Limimaricola sp.]|uniref:alpha-D-ribose 1-methylphosphonate 5-triphosphate diphosphatase n=1 Tax=Limimaricola sp. TaxID=2211665 RepID=UPI001DD9FED4|nr:alpha-D-ribose 1-methylphosphonate 5-triphosphate diphosphatase [Limimaricola sp.]MBI1416459.1 alpha-D-ribose 1-methylphosphonate 5-triphosphate diphosphatase [Limimaricola sp.]